MRITAEWASGSQARRALRVRLLIGEARLRGLPDTSRLDHERREEARTARTRNRTRVAWFAVIRIRSRLRGLNGSGAQAALGNAMP